MAVAAKCQNLRRIGIVDDNLQVCFAACKDDGMSADVLHGEPATGLMSSVRRNLLFSVDILCIKSACSFKILRHLFKHCVCGGSFY